MARRLAPIGHHDELTLVDHLDELRSRLVVTFGVIVVVFGFVFWQSDRILTIITKPIDQSLSVTERADGVDPRDAESVRYHHDRAVTQAIAGLRDDTSDLADAVGALAGSDAVQADDRLTARVKELQSQIQARAEKLSKLQLTAPEIDRRPMTLGVTEPFMVTIVSSLYAALLLSLPLILYQCYAFILPAFTPRERQVAVPLMLMVPVLFLAGVAFAYFVVLPRAADFLLNFNDGEFNIQVQAREALRFTVTFLIGIGLMFQLPVGVLAVTRSGILSVKQLRDNRGYATIFFAIVAAVLTPTPDPATMLLAMAPLVVLYELSMLLASWLDRVRPLTPVDDPGAQGDLTDYAPLPLDDD